MARNYNPKTNVGAVPDSITTTKHGGGEISSVNLEVQNAVTRAGLTVAPADGTGEETNQVAQSLFLHGVKSTSFQAAGTVDAITLTPVSGASGVVIPADYDNLEGARLTFIPTGANTGAVTVSIGQTGGTQLGTKKLLDKDGVVLTGAELGTDAIEMQYDPTADSAAGAFLLLPWAIPVSAGVLGQGYTEIASGSTTSTIPLDDTIPQDDEGASAGTLVYTPKSATSVLKIKYGGNIVNSGTAQMTFSLFTGASANAISASVTAQSGVGQPNTIDKFIQIDSPGTSALTLTLRFGAPSGTTTIGSSTAFYGTAAKAYIEILEVET